MSKTSAVEPSGFAVTERVEHQRVELSGRHRFARYRLVFALTATDSGAVRLGATRWRRVGC